jgi:4a-hydroxytetrahydrobiopterin dehydratase
LEDIILSLLSEQSLEFELKKLNNWSYNPESKKLFKVFRFKDFVEAFDFMTRVAMFSEKINHHPEWKNIYNQIWVELTTHDSGGVTLKDIELAKYMDSAAAA